MRAKQLCVGSLCFVSLIATGGIILNGTSSESDVENQTRAVTTANEPVGTRSSFSSDFNKCLFNGWPPEVLAGQVTCSGQQLCYGGHGSKGQEQALFAVCYNTETLIPEFTGHFLQSGGETVSPPGILTNPDERNKDWISDATLVQVATHTDYSQQKFPNYNSANSPTFTLA